jgi:hypothetical protein
MPTPYGTRGLWIDGVSDVTTWRRSRIKFDIHHTPTSFDRTEFNLMLSAKSWECYMFGCARIDGEWDRVIAESCDMTNIS